MGSIYEKNSGQKSRATVPLKGQNKIKQPVQKIVNIRRHMSILMAF
jgi:hypothetical protein